jgi:hypothetical protein
MLRVGLHDGMITLIIVIWILSKKAKGLIVEKYHLNSVKDASSDMAVDDDHID